MTIYEVEIRYKGMT